MINIAINGFGRIGRNTFKAILEKNLDLNIVAINDLAPVENLAYLLKYDSVYGKYDKEIDINSHDREIGKIMSTGELIVEGRKIITFAEKDPANLPWKELDIDVVLECTGIFRTEDKASLHLLAGAKRVIISAPSKGGDVKAYLIGVNGDKYNKEHKIIDNASCTTNSIAPVIGIMHSLFGVKKSMITTIHAYTADQRLQDAPHKDFRRGRAAAFNIVPTTTGSAIATTRLLTDLENKFDGIAIRVPVITGSLSDFTLLLEKKVTKEEVIEGLKKAVENPLYKGVVELSEEPLVSSDIIGNPASSIIDLDFIRVVDGDLVKILAWYDNEWGYSHRLAEMVYNVGKALNNS